jgi:tripartite-type tricarboxylate transporter receptor subunit TctC
VVENRTGAPGDLAMAAVARAAADGYTLALMPGGNAAERTFRQVRRLKCTRDCQ